MTHRLRFIAVATCIVLPMLNACTGRSSKSTANTTYDLKAFAADLVQALRQEADLRSDYDGGVVIGFGAEYQIESASDVPAEHTQATRRVRFIPFSNSTGTEAGRYWIMQARSI